MFRFFAKFLLVTLVCYGLQSPLVAMAKADAHAVAHEEGGHDTDVPMTWQADLALFSLVTFVLFVAVLRLGAWGPLQAALTERERRIQQNIADAETNRLKSEAMLKEHELKLAKVQEEVRDILAEARRDSEHTRQEILASAQREATASQQRAVAEIERARDLALTELFDFVSNNVVTATEQVIGRSLTGADQDRLVGDALGQLNIRRN